MATIDVFVAKREKKPTDINGAPSVVLDFALIDFDFALNLHGLKEIAKLELISFSTSYSTYSV